MKQPTVGRPHIPGYGIPTDLKGLLAWDHVAERMASAKSYWLATANSDARPHAVPVMGVWVSETLYFGGGPETLWSRNLTGNPRISLHLESGEDVVIIEGAAKREADLGEELVVRIADSYESKYGFRHPPPFWVLKPRVAFAWTRFDKDPTRWVFEVGRE